MGVLEIPEEEVVQKGRLLPGKMFLIDFNKGRMLTDEEYKGELIAKRSLSPLSSPLFLPPLSSTLPRPPFLSLSNGMCLSVIASSMRVSTTPAAVPLVLDTPSVWAIRR